MHEAKTRLYELVKAVEECGGTVILQRHGKPVAEIHPYAHSALPAMQRDLTPDPSLRPLFAPGYDPAEPLAEVEWPSDSR